MGRGDRMSVRRAQDERLEGTPDGNTAITGVMDVPDAPTIGTASDGGTGTTASVTFTAAATGGTPSSYTVTSSPGNISGTGSSSPVTVSGLTTGVSYTFTVTATSSGGTSPASAASNSVTPIVPPAFESIATATITGSSGTITFSSIPSTYQHLQIRYNGRTTAAQTNTQLYVSYNSITSGYANHLLGGNGSTAETNNDINGSYMIMYNAVSGASATADMMGNGIIDIIDYASTSKNKTLRATIGTDRNGQGNIWLISGLMNNTAAVSSVKLTLGSGNWTTDSTVALYGIKGS